MAIARRDRDRRAPSGRDRRAIAIRKGLPGPGGEGWPITAGEVADSGSMFVLEEKVFIL